MSPRPLRWLTAHLPTNRRTVRTRLTAYFGALFLIAGAAVVTIANVLVNRTTDIAVFSPEPAKSLLSGSTGNQRIQIEQLPIDAHGLQANLTSLHTHDVHQFLTESIVALGITTVACLALGYIVAGRALSPVRAITVKARSINANNLHERVKVDGPPDEIKELGDTFDELLDRLDTAFSAQRQFIANASHELRSPLARQRVITEVALGDPDASVHSLRAAHERVLASQVHQERLIEALLALARGQTSLRQPRPIDLARITKNAVDARRPDAQRNGIRIDTSLRPAKTAGDPQLVERLVANLIDNAIHHNVPQGRVEIRTKKQGEFACLDVANTGPVVPADAMDRIFQPFRRAGNDRTLSGDGLGLGLSIVQAIAKTHNATITTRARLGGGLSIQARFLAGEHTQRPATNTEQSATIDQLRTAPEWKRRPWKRRASEQTSRPRTANPP